MSRENIGVVQRFFEARNRNDLEGELAELADDVVWDMSNSRSPYQGVYKGHDGFRQLRREALENWERIEWQPHEFIEAGQCVVVPMSGRNLGRGGIELEWTSTSVYTVRAGKIVKSVLYQSKEEALEVVGLRGEDPPDLP